MPKPHSVFVGLLVVAGWLGIAGSIWADEPAPPGDALEPPPFEQFLVVPLRIHVLTSDELPEANCALTDDDVARIVRKVNGIWNKAGIHFGVESIVREPAVRVDRFNETREKTKGSLPLNAYRVLLSNESRGREALNVYYIHEFSVNGVFLGNGIAIVKETARLRPVPGGIDEPLPRVTSHELGHALGLPHRENRTNLLASGTTGTLLNSDEVERTRARVAARAGTWRVADLMRRADVAETRDDHDQARQVWSWLAEIPGDGAAEARRRLESLNADKCDPK